MKACFDEFNIEFWLNLGTLLGATREGKIIEWDTDIDLCMWNYDRKKLFLALHELKKRKVNFTLDQPLFPNCESVSLRLFPFDCPIDILLWQVKADNFTNLTLRYEGPTINPIHYFLSAVRHYLYCDLSLSVQTRVLKKQVKFITKILEHSLPLLPLKLKTFLLNILQRWKLGNVNWLFITPKRYFEKLGTTKFYGLTFHIPVDVEDYLKYHYGEYWKIPQKKWDWWKDDRILRVKESVV